MSKIKRIRIKAKRQSSLPETNSGSFQLSANALKPKITVYSYNEKEYIVNEVENVDQLDKQIQKYVYLTQWIDIRGLGDILLLEYIEKKFNIHKLVIEDIVDPYQRPKMDEYDNYIFATSRMLYINPELEIENEQLSFLLMPKILISFQESYTKSINTVITRLEAVISKASGHFKKILSLKQKHFLFKIFIPTNTRSTTHRPLKSLIFYPTAHFYAPLKKETGRFGYHTLQHIYKPAQKPTAPPKACKRAAISHSALLLLILFSKNIYFN